MWHSYTVRKLSVVDYGGQQVSLQSRHGQIGIEEVARTGTGLLFVFKNASRHAILTEPWESIVSMPAVGAHRAFWLVLALASVLT